MNAHTGLSLRGALRDLPERSRRAFRHHTDPIDRNEIAGHFARNFAGVPAGSAGRDEDVVFYTQVTGSELPVLLGLYGELESLHYWLPGLPRTITAGVLDALVAQARAPVHVREAPSQQVRCPIDLEVVPSLRASERDAGQFITMGIALAADPDGREIACSVHRMLVVDKDRLTISMAPGRQLLALYERAVARHERLPISINIGAPPAAMIASALSSRFLPAHTTKLGLAGAFAGAPLTLASALSQPTLVLAEAEIVLEGYLDGSLHDERVAGRPLGLSLPEFLGYHGQAKRGLPVVTLTGISRRRSAIYQAVVGPGREQSHILALGGAISAGFSLRHRPELQLVQDLFFPPAGGGCLLLIVQIRKGSHASDFALPGLAESLLRDHPYLKWIVFVDEDVDVRSPEDVLWAMTTRSNLSVDSRSFGGFRPMRMDPSQTDPWSAAPGRAGAELRTFIDATVPFALRGRMVRSFPQAEMRS